MGDNMLVYLSLDLICFLKHTNFLKFLLLFMYQYYMYYVVVNGAAASKQQHLSWGAFCGA